MTAGNPALLRPFNNTFFVILFARRLSYLWKGVPTKEIHMQITDVKHFLLGVEDKNLCVVKVETDTGVYGIGQAGTTTRERAMMGMVDHFKHFLIGKDPRRIEDINQELYRGQYYEGGTIISAALSAIDIALWDILGKHLGVPIWQLLGGATRNSVQCFIDGSAAPGETWAEQAECLVKKGWSTVRFAPETGDPDFRQTEDSVFEPWESIDWTAEQIRDVRRRVGPTVRLAIDYHHRLNVAEAASFCQRIEDVNLMFLEEPIRSESPAAYAALRTMTPIPFAIGEEYSSIFDFAPLVEQGLVNYARLDVCNVGGFTAARKVASLAEAHYIDIMPHTPQGTICFAASIHLCAAVHNFSLLEYTCHMPDLPEDLFRVKLNLDGDRFSLPEDAGLGIEFDEAALEKYPPARWEAPHFRRRDGSFTNY
jgi:galactonate dehydratase